MGKIGVIGGNFLKQIFSIGKGKGKWNNPLSPALTLPIAENLQKVVKVDIVKKVGGRELKYAFQIPVGAFVGVVGESGSGKTTLLRLIAGLERGKGEIVVDGRIWQKENFFLPPQKRQVGFLFQDYALFPNMSVLENLLYVRSDRNLAERLLKTAQIWELRERYPRQLSGGEKQRVALCRALMGNPKLLLLDEPFSAVDRKMGELLQREIAQFHREFKTTTFLVTHSKEEVYRLAEWILQINPNTLPTLFPLTR